MNEWQSAYNAGFRITTKDPSKIAQLVAKTLPTHAHVADIGCGEGRNSIFFATLGHTVDAIDVVNVLGPIEESIRSRIYLTTACVPEDRLPSSIYDGAIAARLIQYLSHTRVLSLLDQLHERLRPKGAVGLSFSVKGGIREKDEFSVQTFDHTPNDVITYAKNTGFELVSLESGANRSIHVPYDNAIETYDVLLCKTP